MFETLVLALDGSTPSDRALAYATELAKGHGSTVHVVHVTEVVAGRGGAGPVHLDENELKAKVQRQVDELRAGGVTVELELHSTMAGGPAHIIAESAERVNADAVVMGTRGHTGLAGAFLGSVSQRLLHLAPCPVHIVPSAHQD